ncbi:protein unc-80 homolog isoform X1 [Lingula anatina]|uniref:Protein unc-80 homolog isoform X1 n=1 Tax=Lingula anatina TaxID=7574 RepID=A0A2R2MLK7_LINAN|nr:protein unc-80 homolog isoform X1 [Lingula anatina]|eukprot:XP_023931089.1 protein unc-80 homolog isoform X1 [Lingula anatina]
MENSSVVGNILKPFSAMAGCGESTSEESLTETLKKKGGTSSSLKTEKADDSNAKNKTATSSKKEGKLDSVLKPDLLLRPMIIITDPVSETCSEVNESPEDGTSEGDDGKNGLVLPPIPITRSHTDSKISYNLEEQIQEVTGSMHYITEDGCLNYVVVLKAVHSVASTSSGAGICERILSVLDCLLDLDIVEKKEKKSDENKEKDGRKKSGSEGTNDDPKKDAVMTVHNLMLDTLFKVYKSLGCPNGCMDSYRGVPTERLRYKGQSILRQLHHVNSTAFRLYLRESISKHPLQENLDFLHAFLGFCVDPSAHLYSPKGNKKISTVSQDGTPKTYEKTSTSTHDSPPKSGFATNFGQNVPGSGAKGTEGLLINLIFKPLVTRLVESSTELHSHENIGLYCDVRQLMHYIKEVHGGTFRRVALSGLLDSMDRKGKKRQKAKEPKKQVLRHTSSNASDSGEETGKVGTGLTGTEPPSARRRRSLFKKKITKIAALATATASDSEAVDERLGRLSPRLSLSGTEEDSPAVSSSSTPKRKFSKFQLTFKKSPKSEGDEDSANETSDSKGDVSPKPRMSFKTTGQATLMLLGAKRKVEGGLFGRKRTNKKISLSDDLSRLNFRRTSAMDVTQVPSASKGESHLVREKKLVNTYIVKSGMLRFSFLLDCCQPGSIPDPQLIAAVLDLEAPVVARACLLLECSYFVQRCNKGDWPTWMKLNLQGFRNPAPLQGRGQPSLHRRNTLMQRGAGRMFHAWGVALGNRLEALISAENVDVYTLIKEIKDEKVKQELRNNDQEEDFLDETVVNPTGMDCPYALKMLACQVLVEITTFLRETYQFLPRSRQHHRDTEWDKSIGRRWSGSHHMGSPNHSQKSVSSVQLAESPHGGSDYLSTSPSDRKISFAVYAHDKSDSDRSSASNLSISMGPDDEKRGRRASQGKKLLRKPKKGIGAQSSIKRFEHNRSIKLKPHEDGSVKRRGSSRRRKVSTTESTKSTEEDECTDINVEELEDDVLEEAEQQNYSLDMPWLKVVIRLANQSNYICEHQGFCHMYCFERQRRSCIRLMNAVQRVYESDESDKPTEVKENEKVEVTLPTARPTKDMFKDRLARRRNDVQPPLFDPQESSMMPTASAASTLRRRDSTPLLERIKVDLAKMKTESVEEKERKEKKPKQDSPMLKYIKTQVRNLTQCPLAIMNKSVPILTQEHLIEMLPVAWELLLESDQEVAAAAATLVLVASVKVKHEVEALMMRELQHEDTTQRINAILRFHALWRFRYQGWCRLEEGAHVSFKVPPPSIDFTVPSPTIGLPSAIIIDPPWTPHFKAKVEEVTINQDQTKSFVTATSTRRKQQQEMIYKALLAEEDRKKAAREKFPMTTVAIQQQAAYEPALHHGNEEHEEAMMQEEINMAARRMSVAPMAMTRNLQVRTAVPSYARGSSALWTKSPLTSAVVTTGEEERVEVLHSHQVQMAQPVFPSVICTASVPIIHLLEDVEVSTEGISVCEVAEKVIWLCLVEDPALFLRHFLEKMTNKDKQEELIFVLRKLLLMLPSLPSQTGHILFNYLVGYIMFNVRAPSEGTVESTSRVLSILWMVIPYVDGIFFKDLKQTLKKEQCEPQLMVTANVPSAKKILIHGPDLTSIPSQLPVHEDTQFCTLLQDSLDFFNIPEEQHAEYFLVDVRTNQIHNGNSYVRDFYFFKRNQYPQLSMVHMNPNDAYGKLQMQKTEIYPELAMVRLDTQKAFSALQHKAIALKFAEVGKVMATFSILTSHQTPGRSHQLQNHVMFVYEELLKLPSFPRKALEAEFGMYKGDHGKEMSSVDSMHKYTWIKLVDKLFACMTGTFGWSGEIPFFLNVINGALLLQCEDTALFRFCIATLINAARKFKHIFATDGFLYIMPTIMRVYSNNQNNPVLVRGVQFACKQFFILHRKPFVLQMFGSIASSLNVGPLFATPTGNKIPAKHLFEMLLALEGDCPDEMDILELVEGEMPLKALDFCYADEPDSLTMLECINMCVTVVAYASDSVRGAQMLTILDALLPQYLQHIRPAKKNHEKAKEELNIIMNLGVSMRALITSCDALTRNMSGQQKHLEVVSSGAKPVKAHMGNHLFADRDSVDLNTRQMEEGTRTTPQQREDEDLEISEYRQPRDSLLCVAAEYYTTCVPRVKELRKQLSDSNRNVELFDIKAHTRLAEIAHTLLKLAPYDPCTMGCRGLQRYMVQVLPLTDWSHEKIRPALHLLLKRLDRMFNKVTRKFTLKQNFDWFAAANLLRGLYLTLSNYPSLAFIPYMKPVINVCLGILLSEDKPEGTQSTQHNSFAAQVPQLFCSSVVKLVAMQMAALGDQYTLEQVCGGSVYTSMEKTQNVLMNFIVPLCIRVGAGRKDCPKVRQEDISYALTIILNTLVPPVKVPVQPVGGFNKPHYMSASDVHNSSVSYSEARSPQSAIKENVFDTAFLGLKVLIVCFPKELSLEWQRIANCIKEIGHKMIGGAALWRFMDFVVTIRSPLFVLLQSFIKYKLTKLPCETEIEFQLQQLVASKVKSFSLAPPKSTGTILIELANELRQIKEELIHYDHHHHHHHYRREDSRKSAASYFNDRRRSTLKFAIVHENQSGLRIEAVAPFQVPGVKRLSKKGPASRSSSTKTRHSINDDSPHWERTPSSKRIKVAEANRILDKFRKDGSEESEASTAAASPTRVLQRQPSVFHTAYIAKQYSVCDELDDILFETLEDLEPQALEAVENSLTVANGKKLESSPYSKPPGWHRRSVHTLGGPTRVSQRRERISQESVYTIARETVEEGEESEEEAVCERTALLHSEGRSAGGDDREDDDDDEGENKSLINSEDVSTTQSQTPSPFFRQRHNRVYHRGKLVRHKASYDEDVAQTLTRRKKLTRQSATVQESLSDNEEEQGQQNIGQGQNEVTECEGHTEEEKSSDEAASSFDEETNGEPSAFIETASDVRTHRLQRADFKSRKTFKVKRMGTKAFSRRSQNRDRERVAGVGPETIAIAAEEVQPTQVEMQELKEIATECVTEQVVPQTIIQEDSVAEPVAQFSLLRKRGSHGGSGIISSPVLEDIPEGLQQRCSSLEETDKIGVTPRAGQSPLRMAVSKSHTELHGELTLAQSPPKGRYKRSRSTENILDASRSGAPSGARSRIARQLGKLGLQSSQSISRSPSISPRQSPARESDPLQRYSSAESIQSITSNEGASLLKKESKIARSANHGKGMDSTRI